ncbi:MAG: hypothetical protein KH415_20210 [Clostridium sp.]|nr:hypothetical protein [Clostridium sp.]
MKIDKIKEMLKNKKVISMIVVGLIAFIGLGTAGFMITANDKGTNNDKVTAVNKEDKNEDKEIEKVKEELEKLNEVDTSKLSEEEKKEIEEKKDLENKIAEAEKKVVDDNNSSSTEEVASGTSNSGSNSTSSKNDSTENNSTNNNTNNATVQNKPNYNNTSDSNKHTHSWNPITSTVHHEEQGHYENILVSEAWTEEVPIYEEQEVYICNGCGADTTSDPDKHMYEALLVGNTKCAGYSSDWKQIQVGTDKITHDAVYESKWIVDKAAWDETVTTGYKCSCGATK